jgi:hypothetical protein
MRDADRVYYPWAVVGESAGVIPASVEECVLGRGHEFMHEHEHEGGPCYPGKLGLLPPPGVVPGVPWPL